MHLFTSVFQNFPGGACPQTPLENCEHWGLQLDFARATPLNGVGLSNASSVCIRGAAVSRAELLQTKTMFAQGVVDKLVQLMADQSHK